MRHRVTGGQFLHCHAPSPVVEVMRIFRPPSGDMHCLSIVLVILLAIASSSLAANALDGMLSGPTSVDRDLSGFIKETPPYPSLHSGSQYGASSPQQTLPGQLNGGVSVAETRVEARDGVSFPFANSQDSFLLYVQRPRPYFPLVLLLGLFTYHYYLFQKAQS